MSHRKPPAKDESILIVGAGVFGLSTALALKQRGYQHVTVVDRYLPPVVDGSSVDISRVIRVDYADPLYGKMAKEAHQGWLTEYKDTYYESGFVMICDSAGSSYIDQAMEVNKSTGNKLDVYQDARRVTDRYPSIPSNFDSNHKAYVNEGGGWADAEKSIHLLSLKCSHAGVSFITGPRGKVVSLLRSSDSRRVVGVKVAHGEPILASQVILSTGAWTNRLLPVAHATTASGQPVGFIQLTEEEAAPLREMPVIINLSTGVFCFPPTPGTNILKIARHGYGFATSVSVQDENNARTRIVSSPKLDSNNIDRSYLTDDAEKGLRDGLRQLVPQFADHVWMNRRFCWYSDTPEGDFIVDYHPRVEGLFLATAGAGQ